MKNAAPKQDEDFGLEDVIEKILKTDDEAKVITGSAKEERAMAEREIEDQKKELKAKYNERAKKRIEVLEDQEEAIAKERIAEVDSLTELKLQKLNSVSAEKKDEWVEKIYSRIIED